MKLPRVYTCLFVFYVTLSACGLFQSHTYKSVGLLATHPLPFDWTRDNDRILVASGDSIYIYDITTKQKLGTVVASHGLAINRVAHYPSNLILFSAGYEYHQEIHLTSVTDSSKGAILKGRHPTWLIPDSALAFDSSNEIAWPISEIFIHTIGSRDTTKIANGFLPMGKGNGLIVFCRLEEGHKKGLSLFSLETGSIVELTKDPRDEQSDISNDGRIVVFKRGNELWTIDLADLQERRVLKHEVSHPRISPFDNSIWGWVPAVDKAKNYELMRVSENSQSSN